MLCFLEQQSQSSLLCTKRSLSPLAAVTLLPEISQLSLLQGMLSKLPPEVLLMPAEGEGEVEGEGEGEGEGEKGDVCLHHKVLTFACDLFERYVRRAMAIWCTCMLYTDT